MNREPFQVGDYLHIYNRGNRKIPIVYDEKDKWRFIKSLRFFNEQLSTLKLFQKINSLNTLRPLHSSPIPRAALEKRQKQVFDFNLPIDWPDPQPLVKILCFFLATNHFHLLVKEIQEGGIAKFMGKLGTGFTCYINLKHEVVGRLFQGPYQSKIVKDMTYLQYLSVYIQVLNAFELYPHGFNGALKDFDKAFKYAINYPFGSLPDFLRKRDLGIIEKEIFENMFQTPEIYKELAYDCLLRKNLQEVLGKLTID